MMDRDVLKAIALWLGFIVFVWTVGIAISWWSGSVAPTEHQMTDGVRCYSKGWALSCIAVVP